MGCFGKLPATGDFIRLNAGGEELGAFDRWLGDSLDNARHALGQSFDSVYPSGSGLFIFRPEARGDDGPVRGLVGAWAASGDNAGRSYPIIVFGSYDYGQLVATGAALPIALFPLLASAYELATQGRGLSVDAFLDRVARIVPPPLDDPDASGAGYRAWLATQPMQALWDATLGTEAVRFWVMQNLLASVEPFRGHELPQTGLCVRLPIGEGDAYAAAVWMDMTLRLAKWQRTLLNVFWEPQRAALIHVGSPHVATFRELIAPSGNAEHIADLGASPTVDVEVSRRALGPQLDALVARTDLTLASFLDGLG